jgi:hypothetical protein
MRTWDHCLWTSVTVYAYLVEFRFGKSVTVYA